MAMATLDDLPDELLLQIIEEHWDLRTLASLAQMNHRLKAIFNPMLYQLAARKKKHNAFFHCAQVGQMENLEILRKNGQDLRVSISNKKQLVKKADRALREKMMLELENERRLRGMGRDTYYFDDDYENPYFSIRTEHGMEQVYTGPLFKNPNVEVKSAISIAAAHGQAEVISWLITHGVGINFWSVNLCPCHGEDDEGIHNIARTPLHLALCHRQFGAAHVLAANGAAHECTDSDGTSMWQGAISSGQPGPALRFVTSVAEAQASEAASFSNFDSIFADVTHHSGSIPTSVDDAHQSGCVPTKGTNTATQDASASIPASIFGGESFGESTNTPITSDPEILQSTRPTEDQIIDAIYTMLDPIAAIDAYANSRQTEVMIWQRRKLDLVAAHQGKVVKRAARRVRRREDFLRRKKREAEERAQDQWECTDRAVHVALGRLCKAWKNKRCRYPRGDCFACRCWYKKGVSMKYRWFRETWESEER